jgi:alkylhydroperoxidase/carboxymuconolactone decarboxylase family protein YurZ
MTDQPRERAPEPNAPSIEDQHRALARERGYHFPTFEWLAEKDPEFEQARIDYVRMTYTRPNNVLPVHYKELIASAILAFRGYPSTKLHLERALREGASVREVLEAMEVASVPGGQAVLHFAVDQLIEIEQEHPELFATDGNRAAARGA